MSGPRGPGRVAAVPAPLTTPYPSERGSRQGRNIILLLEGDEVILIDRVEI